MKKDRFPCDDVHRPKKIVREIRIIESDLETKIITYVSTKDDNKRTDASK